MTPITPLEKSRELLNKFHEAMFYPVGDGGYTYTNRAARCALLAVEEIIAVLDKDGVLIDGDDPRWYNLDGEKIEYWESVKQELEKMK